MSILVVWASPNQDGLTSAAKDNILKGLSEAGGEAEALHLNKRDIRSRRKTSLLQIGTGRTVQYHFPLCQTFTKLLFCHVAVNLHSAILVYFLLPAHVASYHLTHSSPCVPIDKIFSFDCTTWHHIRKEVFLYNPCFFCFFVQNPIYYKNHCKRRISL